MRNFDTLIEENLELSIENADLSSEVKFLQEELDNANEILDGIEEILLNELDTETAHIIYNKIFHIK